MRRAMSASDLAGAFRRWRGDRARVWTVWHGHVPIKAGLRRWDAARLLVWNPGLVAVDARRAPSGAPPAVDPRSGDRPPDWMMISSGDVPRRPGA